MATLGGDLLRLLARTGLGVVGDIGSELVKNWLRPGVEAKELAIKSMIPIMGSGTSSEQEAAAKTIEDYSGFKWPKAGVENLLNPQERMVTSPEGTKLTAPKSTPLTELAPGYSQEMSFVRPNVKLEDMAAAEVARSGSSPLGTLYKMKKLDQQKAPTIKTLQQGTERVAVSIDPITGETTEIPGFRGPAFNPKQPQDRVQLMEVSDPENPGSTKVVAVNKDTLQAQTVPGLIKTEGIKPTGVAVELRNVLTGARPIASFRGKTRDQIIDGMGALGLSASEQRDIPSQFQALDAARKRMTGQQALIGAFSNNLDLNLDLANRISEATNRLGSPAANKWYQWFQKTVFGQETEMDKDVAAFQAIVGPSANEWAKIMTSTTGAGVTSDTARREAMDLLGTALNKSQFKNVAAVMKQEIGNREKGYAMEHQRITDEMNRLGSYIDEKIGSAYPNLPKPTSGMKQGLFQEPPKKAGGEVGGTNLKSLSDQQLLELYKKQKGLR